jgi:hypothetical protein
MRTDYNKDEGSMNHTEKQRNSVDKFIIDQLQVEHNW